MSKNIVIVGGGLSGLTSAYLLKKNGIKATVLEAGNVVGGTMRSQNIDGYLIEYGPNSGLETSPVFREISTELGFSDEIIYGSEESNNRYILRDGGLHALPMSPLKFIFTKLWSLGGKIRVGMEPFQGRAKGEESIAQFVTRRLGKEFLDYAINPFVAGVYAGDPQKLSVQAGFPKLYALEEKYGGLVLGTIRGAKERRERREKAKITSKMFSFKKGMDTFPKGIAAHLGDSVLLNSAVTKISKSGDKYIVEFERNGIKEMLDADIVILSSPAHKTSEMIRDFSPTLADTMNQIYYPSVSEVVFGYKKDKIGIKLDGFGFLVPEVEKRKILGCIWSSTIFPNRSPEGYAEVTTFVGGTRQPEIARLPDSELIKIVSDELKSIMKINGEPDFINISRWEKAIPQYQMGYGKVLQAFDKFENENKGLYFCTNFKGGISVGDCVMSAERLVNKIIETNKN